jgi:hypothetical protein
VKTGVQNLLNSLDSGFRRNDEKRTKQTFYETIKNDFFTMISWRKRWRSISQASA